MASIFSLFDGGVMGISQIEEQLLNEHFRRLHELENPVDPDWYDDGDKHE